MRLEIELNGEVARDRNEQANMAEIQILCIKNIISLEKGVGAIY